MDRDSTWAWLGGIWLTVGLVFALACGPNNDEPSASGDCSLDPATDPAGANVGMLEVRLGKFVAERDDAGNWKEPKFVPYDQEPTLELVNGFQGGFHVEPSLVLPDYGVDGSEKTVALQVRSASGEVLTTKSCYTYGWQRWMAGGGTGAMMRNPRAVFKEDPAEYVGGSVELLVDVTVDGEARKVIRRQLELVDKDGF